MSSRTSWGFKYIVYLLIIYFQALIKVNPGDLEEPWTVLVYMLVMPWAFQLLQRNPKILFSSTCVSNRKDNLWDSPPKCTRDFQDDCRMMTAPNTYSIFPENWSHLAVGQANQLSIDKMIFIKWLYMPGIGGDHDRETGGCLHKADSTAELPYT